VVLEGVEGRDISGIGGVFQPVADHQQAQVDRVADLGDAVGQRAVPVGADERELAALAAGGPGADHERDVVPRVERHQVPEPVGVGDQQRPRAVGEIDVGQRQ
jgi:hypothetical protein